MTDPRGWILFFFNDTATTEIYTLSLHDALPISWAVRGTARYWTCSAAAGGARPAASPSSRAAPVHPTHTPPRWARAGSSAATSPPGERRKRTPSGRRSTVKGRRFETTTSERGVAAAASARADATGRSGSEERSAGGPIGGAGPACLGT